MKVIVFDLGGTLMEYEGMPHSWVDYYKQGIEQINKKYDCNMSASDMEKSIGVLKSYNPRICYREKEYSPEFIFSEVLAHWDMDTDIKDCVLTFFEGLQLKATIYPDTVPVLSELRRRQYGIATLTDLPTAMPDELFQKDISELLNYFNLYVSSSSCGFRKPNCKGLQQIAEYFHVPIAELIFVGDEEKDRATAQNAGCRFICLNRQEKTGKDIHELKELLEILD